MQGLSAAEEELLLDSLGPQQVDMHEQQQSQQQQLKHDAEQLLEDIKQQQLEQQEDQQHDAQENSCPPQEGPVQKALEQGNQLHACQQQPHHLHQQQPSAEGVLAQRHDAITHRKGAKFRPILVGDVLCKSTAVYCVADKLPDCPVYGRIIQDVPLVRASNCYIWCQTQYYVFDVSLCLQT